MNKPILAVFGAFTCIAIATLAVSYFNDAEPAWPFVPLAAGAITALVMYAVERKNRKKEGKSSEQIDSQSD